MKDNYKIIECYSISEAEIKYLEMIQEDCWVIHKALKLQWSWRKFRTVCRFTMKRVEKKPMTIFGFCSKFSDSMDGIMQTMKTIYEIKKQRRLNPVTENKQQ